MCETHVVVKSIFSSDGRRIGCQDFQIPVYCNTEDITAGSELLLYKADKATAKAASKAAPKAAGGKGGKGGKRLGKPSDPKPKAKRGKA